MSSWVCIPCLLVLRGEFNLVSPKRDKGADGTIGDTAHILKGTSDHLPDEDTPALRNKDADKVNEVHGLDVDSSGPWPDGKKGSVKGSWFDRKIHELIAEEKRRWLDPDDMCRLRYIIWYKVIYHMDDDFEGKPYTGSSDPHIDHAHFSGRYETRAESDTRPWGVYVPGETAEEIPVEQKTFNALMNGWATTDEGKAAIGTAILGTKTGDVANPGRTIKDQLNDYAKERGVWVGDAKDTANAKLSPVSPLARVLALPAQVGTLTTMVSSLQSTVSNLKATVDKFTSA